MALYRFFFFFFLFQFDALCLQRLNELHVRESAERDAYILAAREEADRLVSDGRALALAAKSAKMQADHEAAHMHARAHNELIAITQQQWAEARAQAPVALSLAQLTDSHKNEEEYR